ncbi:MAG: hypothetical protein WD009_08885 [Phycisphaeraceae bacterium]
MMVWLLSHVTCRKKQGKRIWARPWLVVMACPLIDREEAKQAKSAKREKQAGIGVTTLAPNLLYLRDFAAFAPSR